MYFLPQKETDVWFSSMELIWKRSCSVLSLSPLCCISDHTPLLSSSQRWQKSRLLIGCAHVKGRKTRGCWKHGRLGVIKVLPLSFSKLHLETSTVSGFKAVTCFSTGWYLQMEFLREQIYILYLYITCSPSHWLSFSGSIISYILAIHYCAYQKIYLITSPLLHICEKWMSVMFLNPLDRDIHLEIWGKASKAFCLFRRLKD